jgi:hypothetical protein
MSTDSKLPRAGHPVWSALGGAAVGAPLALLVLAFLDWRIDPARFDAHVHGVFADGAQAAVVLLCVALAGALLGGSFGGLTRRLFPPVARIVEGAVLLPALCILVYAFGLQRYAPRLAETVPFLWSLLSAVAFGVAVALVPPLKPSRMPTTSPE